MTLAQQVDADISAAMKAREGARLAALRMLKAAIVTRAIERGRDLDDAEAMQVVATLVKQRRDSIEQFAKAGRTDLVDKETSEVAVLRQYMPSEATLPEIDGAVAEAIAESGASSPKDLGKVMKAAMAKLGGKQADGRLMSESARRQLSS